MRIIGIEKDTKMIEKQALTDLQTECEKLKQHIGFQDGALKQAHAEKEIHVMGYRKMFEQAEKLVEALEKLNQPLNYINPQFNGTSVAGQAIKQYEKFKKGLES